LHLYAYLAMVLGLGHQLAVGVDFVDHPLARAYWVAMFVVAFSLIAVFRIGAPVFLFARHRFRVEGVVVESSDVVSIYVGGRELDRLPVRAGQYFRFRLLARDEWWRSHPFSLSAEPDGRTLRFTVKALGDFSERLQKQGQGARVMLEGPCGELTTAVRTRPRVALIGGGIGVTPLRALFEELAGKVDVKLIYRASSPKDTVFSEEFDELTRQPGAEVTYLVGKRGNPNMPENPLSPAMIRSIVPDIDSRDIFLCGPNAMMDTVVESLDQLGVPRDHIHSERFAA
jgi:ferredoxin-NADP reductase